MIRTIAVSDLVLVIAAPGHARADRGGEAFHRVLLVVETSCSLRARFATALDRTAEALPRIARYAEDERMVVALNGAPDIVWEGRARALRRPRAGEEGAVFDASGTALRDGVYVAVALEVLALGRVPAGAVALYAGWALPRLAAAWASLAVAWAAWMAAGAAAFRGIAGIGGQADPGEEDDRGPIPSRAVDPLPEDRLGDATEPGPGPHVPVFSWAADGSRAFCECGAVLPASTADRHRCAPEGPRP